jgi:hypothetical protein
MPLLPARRQWTLPNCPADLITYAPEGYGPGTVALVHGGTPEGDPPTAWINNLPAELGLTPEAAATLVVRWVDALLWTAYWDPTGQVTPATPKIPEWPPVPQ